MLDDISFEEEQGNSSVALFVSLYLVLLAFFILLNSISEIKHEQTDEALVSVRKTFSNIEHDKPIAPLLNKHALGSKIVPQNYFAPIGKVAKEAITLVDVSVVEYGDTMEITLPIKAFFVDKELHIRDEQEEFLQQIVAELTKLPNQRINIEIILPSKMQGISRASSFADKLVELGVDTSVIFAGVKDLEGEIFTLIFSIPNETR